MTNPSAFDRALGARWSTVAGLAVIALIFAAAVWVGVAMPQPGLDAPPSTTPWTTAVRWPPTSPYVQPTPVAGPHGEIVRPLPTTTSPPAGAGGVCRQLYC